MLRFVFAAMLVCSLTGAAGCGENCIEDPDNSGSEVCGQCVGEKAYKACGATCDLNESGDGICDGDGNCGLALTTQADNDQYCADLAAARARDAECAGAACGATCGSNPPAGEQYLCDGEGFCLLLTDAAATTYCN